MEATKFKIVGIGGIASCLLPVLSRYLSYCVGVSASITLIDGDAYEERNRERQRFVRLGNKAEVTCEELRTEFLNLTWQSRSEYISEDNVVMLIRNGDVVFLCVDNHATRKLVSDRCEELDSVLLVSGGNDLTDGNIQVYSRRNGQDMTLPIANGFHPEIMNPEDKNPAFAGCEELMTEGEPQLLFTNNIIAALMLNAFYAYQQGVLSYDEVYGDILTNNARQVKRRCSSATS